TDAHVAAMPVVVMQPVAECRAPLVRVAIHPGIGPLEQRSLDEPLDFSVGAGRIAPRAKMPQSQTSAGGGETVRLIARPVVRHDGRDANAEPPQAVHRPAQKADGGPLALVGQDFADTHPGVIVDGHVRELPAGALDAVAPIARDAVTGPYDAAEFLRIEMQQFPWRSSLVAARQRRQLQDVETRPTAAGDDPGHRGPPPA